ncbi:MAK10-like protein [Tanacetum coccineum]
MEAHLALTQPTQVNKITTPCEICSGPHDTQYCMEDPEQAFVEYVSSRTDEAGGKWYTFKPEQNNLGDTYNPSWKSHPSLSLQQPVVEIKPQQPKEPKPTLEDEFKDLHLNLLVLEVLAHTPIYNAILDKYVESLELGKNGSAFVQGETPAKMGDPMLFTLPSDGTKSYAVGIVKDVEVHIGKLKLLHDFYVLDMKKHLETPLLVGRGFLATANAVIDYRMAKITVGEGITSSDGIGAKPPYYARKDFLDCHLPREWEISRDAKLNPFKDTLVFRRMVEFLGAIPINLKCNMWESEDLIKKPINWDKPPQNRDRAWHAKIRLISPDGEEFTKTIQSIPTTRKLSERESPKEIIDLDHFYDT